MLYALKYLIHFFVSYEYYMLPKSLGIEMFFFPSHGIGPLRVFIVFPIHVIGVEIHFVFSYASNRRCNTLKIFLCML